jgi:hypothetical protein
LTASRDNTMFIVIFFLLISLLLAATIFVFYSVWKDKLSRMRQALINMSLVLFTTGYIFLVLEIIFATVVIVPQGLNFTLTSQRWFEKYWNPINSLGYRDYEHDWSAITTDNILFVVGDSFATGHGIQNISDRFANVLSEKLGESWAVVVIAKNAWTTADEYKALASYPKKPKKIILSHYINDIHNAAEACGFRIPFNIRWPPAVIQPLVKRSYFLNFLYWRTIGRFTPGKGDYTKFLQKSYNDEQVWETYKKELLNIISYADTAGADIDFIVWPSLLDFEQSKSTVSKVSEFLETNNIDVLNVADRFKGRAGTQLTVNTMDAHPNEGVHAEVAELLYTEFGPWDTQGTAPQK